MPSVKFGGGGMMGYFAEFKFDSITFVVVEIER